MIEQKPMGTPTTMLVNPGDMVLIGCNACVRQPRQGQPAEITLTCPIIQGLEPITRTWRRIRNATEPEVISVREDRVNLVVDAPGEYSCTVRNDAGVDSESSSLFGECMLYISLC